MATTYYVDSVGGVDTNSGTSTAAPWKSLTKVNGHVFVAGDTVLFKCGGTWDRSLGAPLNITVSGTSGNPITWSSYGTGGNPLFNGFVDTSIIGWTSIGGNLYTYHDITLPSVINVLTINGVQHGYGRFPKTTYNTYTASSGTTSITDLTLPNSPSFVGGEVVIRKNAWTLTRGAVNSQSSGVITYTATGTNQSNATNGYGLLLPKPY